MYNSFFGFKENPFSLTPDPNYLYLSQYHKEAFDHLLYGINERKGFIVVTGGIGTGKTTLCRALLGSLDSSTKTALIFNAYISDMEFWSTINQEFGIETAVAAQSKKDYIDALNQFLLETFSQDGNAILLIDEAQNLSHTVLEQIRMLSNLETEKEKLIQIVLVGQSELREFLATPSLRQLDERIMVRYDLKPLDKKDVQGYIEHRLVVAGGKGNLRFTRGAFEAIYANSRGNPRRINGICDRALLIAYYKDEFTVSKSMVQKAIGDIHGNATLESKPMAWLKKRTTSLSMLVLLLLITIAALGVWNVRKEISGLISGKQEGAVVKTETALFRPIPAKSEAPPLPAKSKVPPVPAESETPSVPAKPEMKAASLFLDEEDSLAGLFRLFDAKEFQKDHDVNEIHLGLFSFYTEPEHYIMFRKPFRVQVANPELAESHGQGDPLPSPCYLLIREVTADGAVAVDAEGKERPITSDFILTHWGKEVSWMYPYVNYDVAFAQWMSGPDIIKLQQALNELGYSVSPTGFFASLTFEQVTRFQDDFGLVANGIVGTRTKGLLYQMSDQYELHP